MPGDDAIWQLASDLVSSGRAHLAFLGSGIHERWQEFAESFPPVIVLDGNIESLSADLESAIIAIHDQLWPFVAESAPFFSSVIHGASAFIVQEVNDTPGPQAACPGGG